MPARWLFLSFYVAIAACGQQAAPPQDPAIIVESQRQQSAQLASNWLHSVDPRKQAWGAYLVLRDRQTQLVPDLLTMLNGYDAAASGPPVSPAEADQRDTMLGILDALIQLNVDVPSSEAAKLYRQFPAQSLLLLSRSKQDVGGILLDIFRTDSKWQTAWLAAGNLLAARRASGFAGEVLGGMTVRAQVVVTTPGTGFGGSSACSGMHGCGRLPVQPKVGWPPLERYYMWSCDRTGAAGTTILAPGVYPVSYYRTTDGRVPDGLPCGCNVDPDLVRQNYVATLLYAPPEQPPIKARMLHTIIWQDESSYRAELLGFIQGVQETFATVARSLNQAGLMTSDESSKARPKLVLELSDARTLKTTPLPQLSIEDNSITFTQSPW